MPDPTHAKKKQKTHIVIALMLVTLLLYNFYLFTSMTSSLVDCWASSRIPLTNCLLAAL